MAEPIAEHGEESGTCHYDGSGWRKSNLLWGYHDTVSKEVLDTDLGADHDEIYGETVGPGEVWVITAISGRYDGTDEITMYVGCIVDGASVVIVTAKPPITTVWYPGIGQFVLKEGDKVFCFFIGNSAGDDGRLRYCGYKMKIDM